MKKIFFTISVVLISMASKSQVYVQFVNTTSKRIVVDLHLKGVKDTIQPAESGKRLGPFRLIKEKEELLINNAFPYNPDVSKDGAYYTSGTFVMLIKWYPKHGFIADLIRVSNQSRME